MQDDLYRKFKIKYDSVLREEYGQEIDDTMTAERVMLLDAIVAGDLDGIRASTKINWNFVYPPAYTDADSGEKCLEAWCLTATRTLALSLTLSLSRTRTRTLALSLTLSLPRTLTRARCRPPLCLLVRPDEGN